MSKTKKAPVEVPSRFTVQYEFIADAHVFTSEALSGLYVAHHDLKKAYVQLPKLVGTLMRLNFNVDHKWETDQSFEDFSKRLGKKKTIGVHQEVVSDHEARV